MQTVSIQRRGLWCCIARCWFVATVCPPTGWLGILALPSELRSSAAYTSHFNATAIQCHCAVDFPISHKYFMVTSSVCCCSSSSIVIKSSAVVVTERDNLTSVIIHPSMHSTVHTQWQCRCLAILNLRHPSNIQSKSHQQSNRCPDAFCQLLEYCSLTQQQHNQENTPLFKFYK